MKIWFDTEFIEDGKTIDLMSIGAVREDGKQYYAEVIECDLSRASPWVRENVIRHLRGGVDRLVRADIAADLIEFMGEKPEIWAYYADYDWVALCQIFGTMMDLPKGWPMYCRDVKQLCDSLGDPTLPAQTSQEHNALFDAVWTRSAWEFLQPDNSPLPCPFCGNPPTVQDGDANATHPYSAIACCHDECIGPKTTAAFLDDAIFQWNTRASQRPRCSICNLEDGACICAHIRPARDAAEGAGECPAAGCGEVVGNTKDHRWDQGQCAQCGKWFWKSAPPQPVPPADDGAPRSCTCHPDDNPPVPCAQKYALSECKTWNAALWGDRAQETIAAGAIIDVMMGGKFDWRSRLDDSDFLESADWQQALLYAKAALSLPTDQPKPERQNGDGLLPCPFCGSKIAQVVSNGIGDFFVICRSDDDAIYDCGARTSDVSCETRRGAIDRWNTRTPQPARDVYKGGPCVACPRPIGEALMTASDEMMERALRAAPRFWRDTANCEKHMRACLTAALSDQVVVPKNARPAYWTHDDEAAKDVGHLYYFAPTDRSPPPYRHQRHVTAIIDIAADGTLAGVELIEGMPPPPSPRGGE